MKTQRQNKILEIIGKYEVETQDDLINMLAREGFTVTQATISRDIRELKLSKVLTGRGTYRYIQGGHKTIDVNVKFNNALVDSIQRVDYANNIIVIKTFPGLAPAVATSIDAIHLVEILGSIAGDDTIMVIVRDEESAAEIADKLKNIIKTM
jgi:transcriptional regulator of arginine metabolism